MDTNYDGTDIILYVYIYFNMYALLYMYGGSHASDILHVLIWVSVTYPIISYYA